MSRKTKFFGAAIFFLAAAGLWFFWGGVGFSPPSPPPVPEGFFASASFGEGRVYEFEMTTTVGFSTGMPSASGSGEASGAAVQKFSGILNLKPLLTGEGETVLAAQFSPLSVAFRMNGQDTPPANQDAMKQMFLVTMGKMGDVRKFDFSPDLPQHLATILEGAFRTLQVVLPSGNERAERGDPLSWRAMERDSNGDCATAYVASEGGKIRKRRLSYAAQSMEAMRVVIASSDISGTVDDGWVTELSGNESAEFLMGSSRIGAADNEFSLSLLPFERRETSLTLWSEYRTPDQIRGWFSVRRADLEYRKRMAQRGSPAPTGNDRSLTDKEKQDRKSLYEAELALLLTPELSERARLMELKEFLNANPEAAALMPGMIARSENDDVNSRAILALQLSGTPASQGALCVILDDPQQRRMDRLRATAAFSFVDSPTDESVTVLKKASDGMDIEFSSTALLALGGSGYRVRETDPERYSPLADELLTRLAAAQARTVAATAGQGIGGQNKNTRDPLERTALLAIGNARDVAFVPQVAPYMTDGDPAFREAAAGVLRHMGGPEATKLLLERLDQDDSNRVRLAAAKSLAEQPLTETVLKYATDAVTRESDGAVATELARCLGRAAAKRDASARATLEQLWETSDNRDVLRVIRDVRRGRTP